MKKNKFIVFDGDCGFCNKSIMYFARIDNNNEYLFVSNLSKKGTDLLLKFNINNLSKDTIILINNEKYFLKSKAIFNFLIDVRKSKILKFFIGMLPLCFCDKVYDFIAKYKKKIISNSICELPSLEISQKIINK
jgi:predicted DCC family thiol-disulfide oxidoreductase YuxK